MRPRLCGGVVAAVTIVLLTSVLVVVAEVHTYELQLVITSKKAAAAELLLFCADNAIDAQTCYELEAHVSFSDLLSDDSPPFALPLRLRAVANIASMKFDNGTVSHLVTPLLGDSVSEVQKECSRWGVSPDTCKQLQQVAADEVQSYRGARRRAAKGSETSIFRSRYGADEWILERVYPRLRGGHFVDVGCGDGRLGSNTWALESMQQWRGLCIDMVAEHISSVAKARICEPITAAITHKAHLENVAIIPGQVGLTTLFLQSELVAALPAVPADAVVRQVTAVNLDEMLAARQATPYVDFLTLNVGASEPAVIQAVATGRTKYGVLVIEYDATAQARTSASAQALAAGGYKLLHKARNSEWYMYHGTARPLPAYNIHPEWSIPAPQAPANSTLTLRIVGRSGVSFINALAVSSILCKATGRQLLLKWDITHSFPAAFHQIFENRMDFADPLCLSEDMTDGCACVGHRTCTHEYVLIGGQAAADDVLQAPQQHVVLSADDSFALGSLYVGLCRRYQGMADLLASSSCEVVLAHKFAAYQQFVLSAIALHDATVTEYARRKATAITIHIADPEIRFEAQSARPVDLQVMANVVTELLKTNNNLFCMITTTAEHAELGRQFTKLVPDCDTGMIMLPACKTSSPSVCRDVGHLVASAWYVFRGSSLVLSVPNSRLAQEAALAANAPLVYVHNNGTLELDRGYSQRACPLHAAAAGQQPVRCSKLSQQWGVDIVGQRLAHEPESWSC